MLYYITATGKLGEWLVNLQRGKHMKTMVICSVLALIVLTAGYVFADDLDDKISKATDESIDKDDEIGQKDPNIKYIITKSKRGASGSLSGQSGDANSNSVVMGAGSNVKGDIYIIDNSRGDKTTMGGR